MDLKSGRVIFVGDGKGGDALIPFWKRLRRSRANIIAVCMDMSPAYTKAVHLADTRSDFVDTPEFLDDHRRFFEDALQ